MNYAEKKYGNVQIGKIAHGNHVFPTENISQIGREKQKSKLISENISDVIESDNVRFPANVCLVIEQLLKVLTAAAAEAQSCWRRRVCSLFTSQLYF